MKEEIIEYHIIDYLLNKKPNIEKAQKLNSKSIEYLKKIQTLYYDENENTKIDKYKKYYPLQEKIMPQKYAEI
jgi:hypothetical protein